MRWLVLLFAAGVFLMPSLSCAVPKYKTKHGIDVFCESETYCWDKADVEAATEEFLSFVPDKGMPARVTKSLGGLTLTISSGPFDCSTRYQQRECNGLYEYTGLGGKSITAAWFPCISESAFIHEMAHWYLQTFRDEPDPGHENTEFFQVHCEDNNCRMNTVTARASYATNVRVCSEDKTARWILQIGEEEDE